MRNKESFTILSPIEKPLVSYDDFGTFNFIHHFDDFPYYDSRYFDMLDIYRKYESTLPKKDAIPSNYYKDPEHTDSPYDKNFPDIIERKNRTKVALRPPQPYNIFFGVPKQNASKLLSYC